MNSNSFFIFFTRRNFSTSDTGSLSSFLQPKASSNYLQYSVESFKLIFFQNFQQKRLAVVTGVVVPACSGHYVQCSRRAVITACSGHYVQWSRRAVVPSCKDWNFKHFRQLEQDRWLLLVCHVDEQGHKYANSQDNQNSLLTRPRIGMHSNTINTSQDRYAFEHY